MLPCKLPQTRCSTLKFGTFNLKVNQTETETFGKKNKQRPRLGVTADLNDFQTVMAASNRKHENIKTNIQDILIPNIVDKPHDFNEHIT